MAKANEYYSRLRGRYIFSEIAKKVAAFQEANPDAKIIRLGIGDVTRPLPKTVLKALHDAVDEMGDSKTFRGYGPEFGYEFLRKAILENDYEKRGMKIELDEIFISDGAKSDTGNIGDIFSQDNIVAIADPVYPVYLDTNVMSGRAGEPLPDGKYDKVVYMPCNAENDFLAEIPSEKADMIYLCFPNNPTGVTPTRDYLEKWVEYANKNNAVILYDSAYESFIQDPEIPHSIFEIEGAKTCAIEFRSFSKTAGFTGTRCAYTVVPKDLVLDGVSLNELWQRRQSTKFNGVPYIVQKAALAVYSEEGQKEIKESIAYYLKNARVIYDGLKEAGLTVYGGENAPYIWVKTPEGLDSWGLFDKLLNEANVVTTPGVGFGLCGEGYIRLTAFGDADATVEAVERIKKALK